jgi:hypothetical protein
VAGVAFLSALVDLGDLALKVVDQLDARGDVATPGLGHPQTLEQPPAFDPEEISDRQGLPK